MKKANADAVHFHGAVAAKWDAKYRSGSFRKRSDFFVEQMLPLIPVPGNWLDAGCGSGYFSRMLTASGLSVHGIDASRPMVEMARELAGEASLGDVLVFDAVTTVESLPLTDRHFDGCICLSVLEYLDNPDDCLDELQRVLKPGGLLILSVPHRLSPIRLLQRLIFGTLRTIAPRNWEYATLSNFALTRTEVASKLRARGFELRRIAHFDAMIPSFARRIVPPSLMFVAAVKGRSADFKRVRLASNSERFLVRSNEPEVL